MGVEERRARLGRRHHLAAESHAASVVEIARDLVGLHATDPATVHVSAGARLGRPPVAAVEAALYDERTVVRVLAMRRTMFVVPVDLLPVVHAAATVGVGVRMRANLVKDLAQSGVADAGRWLDEVGEATVAALSATGSALATELGEDVEGLRYVISYDAGTAYATTQPVISRVLNQLSAEGHIVRGRPRGSWVSSQYRWAPLAAWVGGVGVGELAPGAAQVELIGRWLRSFGPATVADVRWWTGLSATEVKRALAQLDVVEVDLEGAAGLVLADDVSPESPPEPWAALLPSLDPTAMGWTERGWYLGEHRAALFDRSGNVGPTVWWDGRIVGGWGQCPDGEVVWRLLEDVGADAEAAVEGAAASLQSWLAPVRVTPRFPTPLQRELAGGRGHRHR